MKYTGDPNGAEYGFDKLPDGSYNLQIQEGIEVYEKKGDDGVIEVDKDNVPKRYLKIPHTVVDGNLEGKNYTAFLHHEYNGQQIADILAVIGCKEMFDKKFPGDEWGMLDEEVVRGYQTKITGKCYNITLETYTDKNGNERQNIKRILPYSKNQDGAAPKKSSTPKSSTSNNEDWD